jgi:hypothetical protein
MARYLFFVLHEQEGTLYKDAMETCMPAVHSSRKKPRQGGQSRRWRCTRKVGGAANRTHVPRTRRARFTSEHRDSW